MMATQTKVPLIIPQDLLAFHACIYGKPFHGTIANPEIRKPSIFPEDEDDLDDQDNLGYYHDGAKRSLTEDQIAMFRHSEIQTLLRARRYAKEKSASEYKTVPRSKELEDGEWGVQEADDGQDMEGEGEIGYEAEEEHYARFLEAEQKEMELAAAIEKRRGVANGPASKNGKASTRRIVRELDAVASSSPALDYGDEPKDPKKASDVANRPYFPTSMARGYETRSNNGSIAGKKIWWPVLQA